MKIFVSGISGVETTLAVRGFPVTYYPIDYPFFGIRSVVAGPGYHVACGSLALGDEVELFSLVGDDVSGRRVVDAVRSAGLGDSLIVPSLKNTVEYVALQEVPFGRRQIYCDLKDAQEVRVDAGLCRAAVERADICALLNINYSRPFISLAHAAGKKIATDVSALTDVNDSFNAEFIANADILFLSDEGISTSSADFMRALIGKTNAEVIVMGLGKDGAMYYDRAKNETGTLRAVTADKVLTSGAGSALFSGFLHYYGSCSPVDALKRAQVFAALKLERNASTGGYPTAAEVEARLSNVIF